MAHSWIQKRTTGKTTRYRVYYRPGGREASAKYLGSFKTKQEAVARQRWANNEIAALRIPKVSDLNAGPTSPYFKDASATYVGSRIDIAAGTKIQHEVALKRAMPILGNTRLDDITPDLIVSVVTALHEKKRKRETIQKTRGAIAMVLDHYGFEPNPARSKKIKLPREPKAEINPPTADHVETVWHTMPRDYRLPLLILDATGMRVNELVSLAWGDIDELQQKWRISKINSKTSRARWVPVPATILNAVLDIKAREDREPTNRIFSFTDAQLRMAIKRACTATGTPHFSPHDLRHRRISLMHHQGRSWADIGHDMGQRSLLITADTYTHVLIDYREIDIEALLHLAKLTARNAH